LSGVAMLKILFCSLIFVYSLPAIANPKQALLDFEMANYFLKGKDWKNALKYYNSSQGKLGFEDLETVLCRNLATVHMMLENKKATLQALAHCIANTDYKKIQTSQALREVYKMYAQIKADEVNPSILNVKRRMVQRRMEALSKRMDSAPENAQEAARLGFE
jgi:hypothetical protein